MCVCRWWAGEWEVCSATCGPHGEKRRTVLCIQTVGTDEQALPAKDCQHLLKPKTLISCNRDILCPSDWTVGNWSEVSSGVKRETGIITPHQQPPFLIINQSRVTLEKIAQWPASICHLWPVSCIPHFLVFYLVCFPFLQDLPLTCSEMSWILLAQAYNS